MAEQEKKEIEMPRYTTTVHQHGREVRAWMEKRQEGDQQRAQEIADRHGGAQEMMDSYADGLAAMPENMREHELRQIPNDQDRQRIASRVNTIEQKAQQNADDDATADDVRELELKPDYMERLEKSAGKMQAAERPHWTKDVPRRSRSKSPSRGNSRGL